MKNKLHIAPLLWCILGIIMSSLNIYKLIRDFKMYSFLGLKSTAYALIFLSLLVIISYALVILLKKFGFYMICTVAIVNFVYGTIRFGFDFYFLLGLLGPIVLYLLLQVGEEKSWDLLE